MKLNDGDVIVTAWSENCSGPGWSNQLIWVLVREPGGRLREESIQPGERTEAMATLHNICAAATEELTAWARVLARANAADRGGGE
jgi:hypothetical protein